MAENIKTVTDKSKFAEIFNKFFAKRASYLKAKNGNLNIQFLGFFEDKVAFRIPRLKSLPDLTIIYTRIESGTIYASVKPFENNEDTFTFIPLKFQIISTQRKEDRKSVSEDDGSKSIMFVKNVLSDSLISTSLSMNEKKIDRIKDSIEQDLKKRFEKIRIVLINEAKFDARIKYIQENIAPILIEDLNKDPDEKQKKMFNHYINEIYSKDYKLSSQKEFTSEILVPILFRNIIPYGYIQVNNRTPMNDEFLSAVKKTAVITNELILKGNIFMPAEDKFLVADFSKKGLGVAFKDRRQTRFFRQDSLVSFDIILTTNKNAIIGAIVRNTSFMENGIIKVGLEIDKLDAISEINYDECLDSYS